jgi:CTP:phosphocholine cytidylyltransferase-like protein
MLDVVIIVPEITKGMKSIGSKALLKIKDSLSILEYQIQQLKKTYKKSHIHVIAGFEVEKIKKTLVKYNVNIIYNDAYLSTNQSKCLELFLKQHNSHSLLIVSNGILFKNDPFDITTDDSSKVFLIDKPKINFNIGCCEDSGGDLNYLFYDLPVAWSECVYLNSQAIEKLKYISKEQNISQMYLFETINHLVSNNILFTKQYISKKDIMKINTTKDLGRAKLFI